MVVFFDHPGFGGSRRLGKPPQGEKSDAVELGKNWLVTYDPLTGPYDSRITKSVHDLTVGVSQETRRRRWKSLSAHYNLLRTGPSLVQAAAESTGSKDVTFTKLDGTVISTSLCAGIEAMVICADGRMAQAASEVVRNPRTSPDRRGSFSQNHHRKNANAPHADANRKQHQQNQRGPSSGTATKRQSMARARSAWPRSPHIVAGLSWYRTSGRIYPNA